MPRISRCLVKHGLSRLSDLIPRDEPATERPKKTFKDYQPGFFHVDIQYLPKLPDGSQRRYLYVAIDRATRWVFLTVYEAMTDDRSVDFLQRLQAVSPVKIVHLLTDNGSPFTDRFTSKEKRPSGQQAFDQACAEAQIEHRLGSPAYVRPAILKPTGWDAPHGRTL